MSAIAVTALNVYPVKSCAGTPLQVAHLDARGIVHDREFMIVDAAGEFITQRELPRLALIRPKRMDDRLELNAPGMSALALEPILDAETCTVRVWRDHVLATDQGQAVAEWLSDFLHAACRLVRQADNAVRRVEPAYATDPADQVGFADGYPLLLISEESLADLNSRLAESLPMNRFRPNVVVRGAGQAYAEDRWRRIRIGDVECSAVKACARCITTATNQLTAERKAEPLVTLAAFRRVPRGVLFGQNLIHHSRGTLHVSDGVQVLSERVAPELASSPGR